MTDPQPTNLHRKGIYVSKGISTIIYPVKDIARAKMLYRQLSGVEPYVDAPYYVGFKIEDLEVGLDPNGHRDGMTIYWEVQDIRKSLQLLLDAGARALQDVKDVGGGKLTALVRDADGNIIGLTQSP